MLKFDEEKHEYTFNGKTLISVTQLMRKHGLAPNYDGVDPDVLKAKAERGSLIHKEIEDFNKAHEIGFTTEVNEYAKYVQENKIEVLESELKLNNDIVAGTCDLVLIENEKMIIADIKTTYSLHKESVSWQLSIYAYLYWLNHDENPDLAKLDYETMSGQAFHFSKEGALKVVDVDLKPYEEIERLMECERKGEIYKKEFDNGLIDELAVLMEQKQKLESQIEDIKGKLMDHIKTTGNYSDDRISITYIAPVTKQTFDSDKFKKENAELYKKYIKESIGKESLRITMKGTKNE
ncbi:MAG: hypothetical protein IJJ10_06555 [Bacillus sp. (in: Bacteria)]|nr:hypothetical protein [Bacillus sp. (in: firmicutes)]